MTVLAWGQLLRAVIIPCQQNHISKKWSNTHSEEDPLKHLAVVVGVRLRVKPELVVLVIMLPQVQVDRRRLEDIEVVPRAVNEGRDTAIRVQLDEPGLLLDVRPDVDGLHAATRR